MAAGEDGDCQLEDEARLEKMLTQFLDGYNVVCETSAAARLAIELSAALNQFRKRPAYAEPRLDLETAVWGFPSCCPEQRWKHALDQIG